MTALRGADSATPQLERITDEKVWGVYVAGDADHIWTRAEIESLASKGVEAVLPIVVPPQDEQWWKLNHGYAILEAMVRAVADSGVPSGAPLCLDIEAGQAEQMGTAEMHNVAHAWAVATRVHNFEPWSYSTADYLAQDSWGRKWLASWPDVIPTDPELPEGHAGWQYAGNVDGIDLDVFEALTYMTPDFQIKDFAAAAEKLVDAVEEKIENETAKVEAPAEPPEETTVRENTDGASAGEPAGAPSTGDTATGGAAAVSSEAPPVAPLDPDTLAKLSRALSAVRNAVGQLLNFDNELHAAVNTLIEASEAIAPSPEEGDDTGKVTQLRIVPPASEGETDDEAPKS